MRDQCRVHRQHFRGVGDRQCLRPWDAYFRDLCRLYPTLSTSMGFDESDGAIEAWGDALLAKERALLRRYVMRGKSQRRGACLEQRVFHHHLTTRLRCLEVDRVCLFHKNGGWAVDLVTVLTTYQPYDGPADIAVAKQRMKRLPDAIRGYVDFLRLEADRRRPARRIVEAMRERVSSTVTVARSAGLEAIPAELAESFVVNCLDPLDSTLLTFLRDVPCRETLGLSELHPTVYDGSIRRHVTIDGVSADDVHAFGLSEVTRLEGVLETLPAPMPEGARPSVAETLAKYTAIVDRMQTHPYLSRLFGDLRPSRRCSVAEMPEEDRANGPLAYYTNSVFYVNTVYHHPDHQMEALALHEAVPGHHFQRRIERDLLQHAAYRFHVHHTAFVEGWAMYTESLLPTSLVAGGRGVVESELFRAVRLVVDTGIHRKGWSYERAVAYMKAHGRVTDEECASEVLRYACDPGQALGYHIGCTVIRDIVRAHADDLVGVHQKMLRQGSVPMSILIRQFSGKGAEGSVCEKKKGI